MGTLKKAHIVIIMMATAQVLHETLDELEDTPYYRMSLKQVAKRFQEELGKACDKDIKKLWDIDDETMMEIQKAILLIAEQIANSNPAELVVVGEALENGEKLFTFKDEETIEGNNTENHENCESET